MQEILLERPGGTGPLGLTLCYEDEAASPATTEIFIDDIAPTGLAARDGRLRLGDQIVQVCIFFNKFQAKSGHKVCL